MKTPSGRRAAKLALALLMVGAGVNLTGPPASGAPAQVCIDTEAFDTASAPAGSADLGDVGVAEDFADGEVRILTGLANGVVDLRISWNNNHEGPILDPGATGDFVGLDAYASAIGGANGVLRYFPRDDEVGTVTFEFLWAGTATRAPIEMTRLLTGGQRDFAAQPVGVAEFALLSGGPSGAAIAPSFADPDVVGADSDGSDGISGLGSTPIIELNNAAFGPANQTAYNEVRKAYVSTGAFEVRDWTILDWGGATGDTLRWDLYGSNTSDPELASLATAVGHGGLSAYIAGLCFVPPEYDLAVVNALGPVPTNPAVVGDELTFQITIANQGTVPAGSHTILSGLPAGTSWVSDSSGATAVHGTGSVEWTFPDLAAGAQKTFDLVVRIDTLAGSYRHDVEIAADSGADVDSDPASTVDCWTAWDNHNDALTDVDGPGGVCDDHDSEVVEFSTTYSIGNRVWFDANNNGIDDAGEASIASVWVELFTDNNADGLADDTDSDGVISVADAVATAGTDVDGLYVFKGLAAGDYIVGIPPMEWDVDGPLNGFLSSTKTADITDNNVDSDDDGRVGSDGYVFARSVTLGDGEPTGEVPDNDDMTDDANENLTVDFGFWEPTFDLALRKQLKSGGNSAVVAAGDPVTFTITVLNQGNVRATDISIVDYVPDGLTLSDSDWTKDGSTATVSLAGMFLLPGQSISVDVTFLVSGTSTAMTNLAEITAARPLDGEGDTFLTRAGAALVDVDSTPDANNTETATDDVVDNTGGDEDDHDVAEVVLAAEGPGGGSLPATGSDTPGLWYPATIAVMVGGLLMLLERKRV